MTRKTRPPKPTEIVTDSAVFTACCPKCSADISLQATVETFGEPANWNFWGRKGERWQRCEGESGGYRFIHFRIIHNERFNERIAWIKPAAAPAPVQEQLL